jgi:hypothetical protein
MSQQVTRKFQLGRLLMTPGALASVPAEEIGEALRRHASGDWGEVCPEDRDENELSLKEGFRLLSVYRSGADVRFWIITEADRSSTTILLHDECASCHDTS